jgi:hypothetical protein
MTTDVTQYYGQTDPTTGSGDWNSLRFQIQQQIMNLNTNIPVKVLRVYGNGVSPVGFVDVRVLVSQVTGNDMTVDNLEIPNVPYMRLQGGTNAVIIDPEAGDIGMGSFCSRDISAVKNARQEAPPGSRRAYNFSDCMYTGGFLNKAPTQYIQFTSGGILVHSANGVEIGDTAATVNRLVDERMLTLYNAHTHTSSTPGNPTSPPLAPMTAAQLTTLTKAN